MFASAVAGCGGGHGSGSAPTLRAAKAPPPIVTITDNSDASKQLLVQAVGTPNTTVRLAPGLDMDLSGYGPIDVAHGVTLTSDHVVEPVATSRQSFLKDPSGNLVELQQPS